MLADLDSAVKQRDAAVKRARGNDKDARDRLAILEPVIAALEAGRPARSVALSEDQRPLFRRSEEHTSELQSLMRNSYAVFCLNKKNKKKNPKHSAAPDTNSDTTRQLPYVSWIVKT